MNKTLALSAFVMFAVIMGTSAIAPAMADPPSGEKDNACFKEKNPKSNAESAVGCGDLDGDGIADRYDDEFNDADGDGVGDGLDLCPDTEEGTVVDETGCPIETEPET